MKTKLILSIFILSTLYNVTFSQDCKCGKIKNIINGCSYRTYSFSATLDSGEKITGIDFETWYTGQFPVLNQNIIFAMQAARIRNLTFCKNDIDYSLGLEQEEFETFNIENYKDASDKLACGTIKYIIHDLEVGISLGISNTIIILDTDEYTKVRLDTWYTGQYPVTNQNILHAAFNAIATNEIFCIFNNWYFTVGLSEAEFRKEFNLGENSNNEQPSVPNDK